MKRPKFSLSLSLIPSREQRLATGALHTKSTRHDFDDYDEDAPT